MECWIASGRNWRSRRRTGPQVLNTSLSPRQHGFKSRRGANFINGLQPLQNFVTRLTLGAVTPVNQRAAVGLSVIAETEFKALFDSWFRSLNRPIVWTSRDSEQ